MIVPPPDLARPPCPVCGTSMDGRNSGARFCCAACRVEAWRLRRLLDGEAVGPYASVHERLATWGTSGAPRAVRAARNVQSGREGA